MSRIGKKIINIPSNVEVNIAGNNVVAKGPKGRLSFEAHPTMKIERDGSSLTVVPVNENQPCKNFHGLTRSLLNNMVVGVAEGFSKSLMLKGVGYRAQVKGHELNLTLGFSHPVNFAIPEGIQITVDKQVNIMITGADKTLVGEVAAKIRAYRPPEPYHGKGVRYSDEVIVTKVGKASGKK